MRRILNFKSFSIMESVDEDGEEYEDIKWTLIDFMDQGFDLRVKKYDNPEDIQEMTIAMNAYLPADEDLITYEKSRMIMRHILNFKLFEKKEENVKVENTEKAIQMIEDFKKDFGTELDERFSVTQIKLLRKAFGHFNKKFLKNKVHKIMLDDLGGVHGRWKQTPKKRQMTLNPSIFDFKKEFENGTDDIPYKEFVIVHEIGHCIDHIEKISFSKKWQAISGWKKCDINDVIPEGYDRYIEKRKGREVAGTKKSGWIYKEGSDFCRKYSSRNPREDFADSFAFAVFKNYSKFKGECCKEKLEILKKVICEID